MVFCVKNYLKEVKHKLEPERFKKFITQIKALTKNKNNEQKNLIILQIKNIFSNKHQQLKLNIQKLDLLSPLKTMSRGYCVCFNKEGKLLKKVEQIKTNDILDIKLINGFIKSKVLEVK